MSCCTSGFYPLQIQISKDPAMNNTRADHDRGQGMESSRDWKKSTWGILSFWQEEVMTGLPAGTVSEQHLSFCSTIELLSLAALCLAPQHYLLSQLLLDKAGALHFLLL